MRVLCRSVNFHYVCIIKKPNLPANQSIRHIRRLSKAIAGALYPVQSDPSGQQFLDISAAAANMMIV